ncbi:MAG TPA: sugar phosphate isomerase/epimerase family protein [Clostridiaceae bacterium]|nr:sugar phosphate isomerase/epimerase family protein [Clostridiaceae bacterium]
MKLSISNIAWSADQDERMYRFLNEMGYSGIEIAPTRIFSEDPYGKLPEAKAFAKMLEEKHQLEVPSMQSIWFGKTERIFGSEEEREILLAYTKKAVDFAAAVRCKNLVFGCPRNRVISDRGQYPIAVTFFSELGEYAKEKGTVIAIEPNPPIYQTNFINTTREAFALVADVNCEGLMVNIDIGTVIENGEDLDVMAGRLDRVSHIHISEPFLARIAERELHKRLFSLLDSEGYEKYISIEMKNLGNLDDVQQTMRYVKEVFQ